MELRELRYFLAVYETGSVTAAARRCFISQPSISAAIAALERELKTCLFVRHRKGAAPTAAADALHGRARRLVDEASALRELFDEPPAEAITVGLMRTLDIRRTLALLTPLTGNADLCVTLVDADEGCDARIIARRMTREDEVFLPLWSEGYVLALPPRHRLTLQPRVKLADLEGLRLVARCHCENSDVTESLGYRPEIAAVAASEEWAMAMVEAGVGAAVVPEGVAVGAGVVVRPIADLTLTRDVGLAFARAAGGSPAVKRVVQAVKAPPREVMER